MIAVHQILQRTSNKIFLECIVSVVKRGAQVKLSGRDCTQINQLEALVKSYFFIHPLTLIHPDSLAGLCCMKVHCIKIFWMSH